MQSSKFPPPPAPPTATQEIIDDLNVQLNYLDQMIDINHSTLNQINDLNNNIESNKEYNPAQSKSLLNSYSEAIVHNLIEKDYVSKSLELLNNLIDIHYPNDPLFTSQLTQKKKLDDTPDLSSSNSPQIKKLKTTKPKFQSTKPHIPLVKGTRVASLPKGNEETQEWILSTVIKCFSDRNRVDVEDAEEAEDGGKKQVYSMSKTHVIPLPLRTFPPPKYPADSKVLALYPNTTCFYQATVIKCVNDPDIPNLNECLLKFEDDEDNQHFVDGYYVLDYPYK